MSGVFRETKVETAVDVDDAAAADSGAIDFRRFAQMEILSPSGSTYTTLAVWASHDGTTWFDTGETVTITADEAAALPDACFACAWIAFVGDQTGAETCHVSMKG